MYHPQTDGQTEHVNQCVEQYLWNFWSYQQDNWVDWIGPAEFQYTNLIHPLAQLLFMPIMAFTPPFILPLSRKQLPLPPLTSEITFITFNLSYRQNSNSLKRLPCRNMTPIMLKPLFSPLEILSCSHSVSQSMTHTGGCQTYFPQSCTRCIGLGSILSDQNKGQIRQPELGCKQMQASVHQHI